MIPPLLRDPPDQPLLDPSENAEWYGEIVSSFWIQFYPLQEASSAKCGQCLKELITLLVLRQSMATL